MDVRWRWLALGLASAAQAQDCAQWMADGHAAFRDRSVLAAIANFEQAAAACPDKIAALVPLAQMQYLAKQEIEAEASLKRALAIDPQHVPALYALGRVYYQQHRYPEAAARFEAVVQLEPGNFRAHDNLALCYDALVRDADALRHFFKALDLVMKDHPEYDWAHANLADFFLKRNEHEKAFQLAAEAARRNPVSARNAFLTGKALVKLERHELSLRWLEQAVKLDPDSTEAWYLLAQACRKLGRTAEADRALSRFKEANSRGRERR